MNEVYEKIREVERGNWWYVSRLELIKQIVKEFCQKKRIKILDLGCGTGSVAECFMNEHKVVGLDSMRESIIYASKRGIKARKGNIEDMPFKKESFDVVLCLDVLEHIKNDKKAVKEVYRVLRNGGNLIITVPAFDFLWGDADELSFHFRRYTKKRILELLKDFKIKKCSYWNTSLFFPALVFRTYQRATKHLRKPKKPDFCNMIYTDEMGFVKPLNKALANILRFENMLIKKISLPFGVSLVVVCEK